MGDRLGVVSAQLAIVGCLMSAAPVFAQSQPAGNNAQGYAGPNYPAPNKAAPNYTAPNSQPAQSGLRQPGDMNLQNQAPAMQNGQAAPSNYPAAQSTQGPRQPAAQSGGALQMQGNPAAQQHPANQVPLQSAANPGLVQIEAKPLPAPFTVTPQQQEELDKLLTEWEAASGKVDLFSCSILRMEYDSTFGGPDKLRTVSHGNLEYKSPDKGLFQLISSQEYRQDPATHRWELKDIEPQEYWTCDGKSTYQVDSKQKLVIEDPIPPSMQGKSITDGPLPFVFGAKADALKKRYYMRTITPPAEANTRVWLEAFPKSQRDAANFAWVELILTKDTKLPVALQIYSPGCDPKTDHNQQSRTMISLDKPSVNSSLDKLENFLKDFARPNPIGYKHVLRDSLVPPPTTVQAIDIKPVTPPPTGPVGPTADQPNRLQQPPR